MNSHAGTPTSLTTTNATSRERSVLLDVTRLGVHFPVRRGPFWQRRHGVVRAVDGISFYVPPGRNPGPGG